VLVRAVGFVLMMGQEGNGVRIICFWILGLADRDETASHRPIDFTSHPDAAVERSVPNDLGYVLGPDIVLAFRLGKDTRRVQPDWRRTRCLILLIVLLSTP